MQKSSGISMISLIVTIIITVLLSAMAIGTGTKYLRESRERDRSNFVSVLSSAVSKRHEETNLSSLQYPYLGYYINDSAIFETIFAPKIKESVNFEDGIWYVVDTTTAVGLGLKEPENYINTIDESYSGKVTVALVNYATGDVYLIDTTSSELGGMDFSQDSIVTGHTHRYLLEEPTCTEAKKCAECGFILEESLGHLYDPTDVPSPAAGDEENSHYNRICKRPGCNMAGGFEPHSFGYNHVIEDDLWYHQVHCTICTYVRATKERCTEQYTLPESDSSKATSHIVTCRYCKHTDTENHDVGYRRITEVMHEKYCMEEKCGYVIATEYHVDDNTDEICDLCGSEIINYTYPQLGIITMINKSATTEKGKYAAKYGDVIEITMIADKAINTPEVIIAGKSVTSGITTSDNRTWVVELELTSDMNIPNGNITFKINCESTAGVGLLAPVTQPSDGKYILFDGTAPVIEYIDKNERAIEE